MNIKIMEEIMAERKTLETERKKLLKAKEVLESRQNELRELGVKEQVKRRKFDSIVKPLF